MAALYALVILATIVCYGIAFVAFVFILAAFAEGALSAYWHLIRPLRARQTK